MSDNRLRKEFHKEEKKGYKRFVVGTLLPTFFIATAALTGGIGAGIAAGVVSAGFGLGHRCAKDKEVDGRAWFTLLGAGIALGGAALGNLSSVLTGLSSAGSSLAGCAFTASLMGGAGIFDADKDSSDRFHKRIFLGAMVSTVLAFGIGTALDYKKEVSKNIQSQTNTTLKLDQVKKQKLPTSLPALKAI